MNKLRKSPSSSRIQSNETSSAAQLPKAFSRAPSFSDAPPNALRLGYIFGLAGSTLLLIQFLMLGYVRHGSYHDNFEFGQSGEHLELELEERRAQSPHPRCAINFWGLPRAFESLVLPSIEKNVISVNAKYGCDYFMHYYDLETEDAGRSGVGGRIDVKQVYKLRPKVKWIHQQNMQSRKPIVEYVSTTDKEFWAEHKELITKIRETTDANGKHVYFPDNAKTYKFPTTTDNIIKMWHTIQSSWNLMERHERKQGIVYERVAMLRNDVVYVTPVDIYQIHATSNQYDTHNKYAVIPGFGRHPVSDRMVYGPRRAVNIWASQRFGRLEQHVWWIRVNDPGWGIHSERFMNYTLLAAMKEEGVEIVEHDEICFFRARADESTWISDCDGGASVSLKSVQHNLAAMGTKREVMEKTLGRACQELTTKTKPYAEIIFCRAQPLVKVTGAQRSPVNQP